MSNEGFNSYIDIINIKDPAIAGQIFSLQQEAYQVEAKLIGTRNIPPLMETIEQLMDCGETFLGYFEQKELKGALSYKRKDREIVIYRMMVAPNHFRKGIAKSLLYHLEQGNSDAKEIFVSTGSQNLPAIRLYARLGFSLVGETVIDEGLRLSRFIKIRG